ncbi:unnamed protein product [Polarella glacialis]|uniref:WW domain-containing protein n=1 Tax=Polarella glacialis TaxID=89957 RepID=A0A813KCU9_POLGL|nr:unnamed protein product [Polarella glacialis]
MASGPPWVSDRPRRAGAARREQELRAQGRSIQRFLRAIDALDSHRGCRPTSLGAALAQVLRRSSRPNEGESSPSRMSPTTPAGSNAAPATSPRTTTMTASTRQLRPHAQAFVPRGVVQTFAGSFAPMTSAGSTDDSSSEVSAGTPAPCVKTASRTLTASQPNARPLTEHFDFDALMAEVATTPPLPKAAAPAQRLGGIPAPWEAHFSEEFGIPYYWNADNGESLWETPATWRTL